MLGSCKLFSQDVLTQNTCKYDMQRLNTNYYIFSVCLNTSTEMGHNHIYLENIVRSQHKYI